MAAGNRAVNVNRPNELNAWIVFKFVWIFTVFQHGLINWIELKRVFNWVKHELSLINLIFYNYFIIFIIIKLHILSNEIKYMFKSASYFHILWYGTLASCFGVYLFQFVELPQDLVSIIQYFEAGPNFYWLNFTKTPL